MENPFDIVSNKVFALYLEAILEPFTQEYKTVVSLDTMPDGPISQCVFHAKPRELSIFRNPYETKCKYYLTKYPSTKTYMDRDDIPKIYSYLEANGYTIDKNLTKLYKENNTKREIICVVKYNY
jgi:hypothetical protein